MASNPQMGNSLFSGWGFKRQKGLVRNSLRNSLPAGNFGPLKKFFFGNLGPFIKMWTGTIWDRVALWNQENVYTMVQTAPNFVSTVTTGTAPIAVTSTTVNTNLNSDFLDGQHGSYYASLASPVFTTPIRLKGYTVATLPTGTQGDYAYVTDALLPTFLATVAGGGAIVSPVFYNGTNWVTI